MAPLSKTPMKPVSGPVFLWDGARNIPATAGGQVEVAAQHGVRYRLTQERAGGRRGAVDTVVALREGHDDLVLLLGNRSRIVVKSFFKVCAQSACGMELPGADGIPIVIDGDARPHSVAANGDPIVYSLGNSATTLDLVESYARYHAAHEGDAAADTASGGSAHLPGWLPVVGGLGLLGGGIAALASGHGGSGAPASPEGSNTGNAGTGSGGDGGSGAPIPAPDTDAPVVIPGVRVSGNVVAGPVVAGHTLSISFYDQDGNRLAGPVALKDDGTYEVTLPSGYTGVVVGRVSDASEGADYIDEATGQAVDLAGELRVLLVVDDSRAAIEATVSPITEIAVQYAQGVAAGAVLTPQLAAQANSAVATALGISGALYQLALPVITPAGTVSPDANQVGRVLAALSGAQASFGSDVYLGMLVNAIQAGNGNDAATMLAVGATRVDQQLPGMGLASALAATSARIASAINEIAAFEAGAESLTPVQMAALSPYRLAGLTAEVAGKLTATQVGALSAEQLGYLSIAALEAVDTASMTPAQLSRLGAAQLQALYDMEAATIATPHVDGFTINPKPYLTGTVTVPVAEGNVLAIYSHGSRIGTAELSPDRKSWVLQVAEDLAPAQWQFVVKIEGQGFGVTVAGPEKLLSLKSVASLTAGEIASLPAVELPYLSSQALADLSTEQLYAFSVEHIHQMSVSQRNALFQPTVDTHAFPQAALINDATPSIVGTLRRDVPDGVEIAISLYENGVDIGKAEVTGATWRFTPATPLADGLHHLVVVIGGEPPSPEMPGFDFTVDTIAPTISGVLYDRATSQGMLKAGDVLSVIVSSTEPVHVDTAEGVPTLKILVGNVMRTARLDTSAPGLLKFIYQVVEGDMAATGLAVPADSLSLNGGRIVDAAGNALLGNHSQLEIAGAPSIDTQAPSLERLNVVSGSGQSTALAPGAIITVEAHFDEAVLVQGEATLAVQVGGAVRQATYTGGSGTATLVFTYTVQAGDLDADGIVVPASALAGSPIQDFAGNAAIIHNDMLQTDIRVDAVGPVVATIALAAGNQGNALDAGDSVDVHVTFSEAVFLDASGTVALQVGAFTRLATYVEGSGTQTLVFRYVIAAGDKDADGISIAPGVLAIEGPAVRDGAGNAADIRHGAVAPSSDFTVDAVTATIESITATGDAIGGPLVAGNAIRVTVMFDEAITLGTGGGMPHLMLRVGSELRSASFETAVGTRGLQFRYVVAAGDLDADGVSVEPDALRLNGATIKEGSGKDASVAVTPIQFGAIHVDAVPAQISSVELVRDGQGGDDLKAGDAVLVKVHYAKAVTVAYVGESRPSVALDIGGQQVQALYSGGSGGTTLEFRYVIKAGDRDGDGVTIGADALALNGATLRDANGQDALLAHADPAEHTIYKVDTAAPVISDGPNLSRTGNSNVPMKAGDVVHVRVEFDEAVTVHGEPGLTLLFGTDHKVARYENGGGTRQLTFAYTVQPGDAAPSGVGLAANGFVLDHGTITDAAGNAAVLSNPAGAPSNQFIVDTVAPQIQGVPELDRQGNLQEALVAGDIVRLSVTFDETVFVHGGNGMPRIRLEVGGTQRWANYVEGDGTRKITFAYTIQGDDGDEDGISVLAGAIDLNGATVTDAAGNAAQPGNAAVPPSAEFRVSGTHPQIVSIGTVEGAPAEQFLGVAAELRLAVSFDSIVTVNMTSGKPRLRIDLGGTEHYAEYLEGTGSKTLVFRYVVLAGDAAQDGVAIAENALELNGSTIVNTAGRTAVLDNASGHVDGPVIDTSVPHATSIVLESPDASPGGSGVGDRLQVSISYDEIVRVSGSGIPSVTLQVGQGTRVATYKSGSGSQMLLFEYVLVEGDQDLDGVTLLAGPILHGDAIVDRAGNAGPASIPMDVSSNVIVDTSGAALQSIAVSGTTGAIGAVLIAGSSITFEAQFDEAVTVDTLAGVPSLAIKVGNATRTAVYSGGSGGQALQFTYTIQQGDLDTDGISVMANSLSAPANALVDAFGNRVLLTHAPLADDAAYEVDATAPEVSSIRFVVPSLDHILTVGDTVRVDVVFSTSVGVSAHGDLPYVGIQIGNHVRHATYLSGSDTARLAFEYIIVAGDTHDDGNTVRIHLPLRDRIGKPQSRCSGAAGIDGLPVHLVDPHRQEGIAIRDVDVHGRVEMRLEHDDVAFQEPARVSVPRSGCRHAGQGRSHRIDHQSRFIGDGCVAEHRPIAKGVLDCRAAGRQCIGRNGNAIIVDGLVMNGAKASDAAGNDAVVRLESTNFDNVKVDAEAPEVSSVRFADADGHTLGTLSAGDVIWATVTFSEAVQVDGAPVLKFHLDGADVEGHYVAGSDAATARFQYVVQGSVNGAEAFADEIVTTSGHIADLAGNTAILTI